MPEKQMTSEIITSNNAGRTFRTFSMFFFSSGAEKKEEASEQVAGGSGFY